jgi:hypothetical protein
MIGDARARRARETTTTMMMKEEEEAAYGFAPLLAPNFLFAFVFLLGFPTFLGRHAPCFRSVRTFL